MTTFLTARWLRLAVLNYEVDPALLVPRVPRGTEVDTWNGRCFVSMVGFRFLDTRLAGVAVPFHRDFLEVNLRYYVKRRASNAGETRHGVVFVKEIVPRPALALVARLVYNENYVALPMRNQDTGNRVEYGWTRRGRAQHLAVSIWGEPRVPEPGSEAAFIIGQSWGYAAQRDGSTLEYEVEHPPWRLWPGRDPEFECDVESLYGAEFVLVLRGEPSSSFVAEGSEVIVRRGVRLS